MKSSFYIIILVLTASCNSSAPSDEIIPDTNNDSVSNFLYSEVKDNLDCHYYGDDKNVDSVLMYDGDHKVQTDIYQNGEVFITRYFGSDIEEHLIINNKLTVGEEEIILTDLVLLYDRNGNLLSKGFQGVYDGAGVPVGTWYKYQNGMLSQEIYYHNDKFGQDYILYKIYDEGGNFEEVVTNNFILYENDSTTLSVEEYLERK